MLTSTVKSAKAAIKKLSFKDLVKFHRQREVQRKHVLVETYDGLLANARNDHVDDNWLADTRSKLKIMGITFERFESDVERSVLQVELEQQSAQAEQFQAATKRLMSENLAIQQKKAEADKKFQEDLADVQGRLTAAQANYSAALRSRETLAREFPRSATAIAVKSNADRKVAENRLDTLGRELREAQGELLEPQEVLKDRLERIDPVDRDDDRRANDFRRDAITFEDRCHRIQREIEAVKKSLETESATVAA